MNRAISFLAYRHSDNILFIKNAVLSIFLKGLSLGLVMVVAVLLARRMGPTQYGRLAYIQSIAVILSSVCTLGLRDATNRIVARYAARRNLKLLGRFISFGIAIITVVSWMMVPIVYKLLLNFSGTFKDYRFSLWTVLGVVVSLGLLSYLGPTLVALGRPVLSFSLEHIGTRLLILIVALAYTICGASLNAETALEVTIAGNFAPVIALVAFIFIPSRLPLALPRQASYLLKNGRVWLSISLFMMTSPLISLVLSETAIIVLGVYGTPSEIAFYQIARRVSGLATVCGAVAIYIALPGIARYYILKRYDQLQNMINIINALTIIPSVSVILILIIGGDRLLLLFGPEFSGAYTAALILAIGRAIDQLFGPVLEILFMIGQHAIATWINIAYGILTVLLNIALIPYYGQSGAATATVTAALLWKGTLYLSLRRGSSLEPCLPLALARRARHPFAGSGVRKK
jgi:O-antigen/teichoic acid export membrane protein